MVKGFLLLLGLVAWTSSVVETFAGMVDALPLPPPTKTPVSLFLQPLSVGSLVLCSPCGFLAVHPDLVNIEKNI